MEWKLNIAMIVKILQRQRRAKETEGKRSRSVSMEEQQQILKMKKELAGKFCELRMKYVLL